MSRKKMTYSTELETKLVLEVIKGETWHLYSQILSKPNPQTSPNNIIT